MVCYYDDLHRKPYYLWDNHIKTAPAGTNTSNTVKESGHSKWSLRQFTSVSHIKNKSQKRDLSYRNQNCYWHGLKHCQFCSKVVYFTLFWISPKWPLEEVQFWLFHGSLIFSPGYCRLAETQTFYFRHCSFLPTPCFSVCCKPNHAAVIIYLPQ